MKITQPENLEELKQQFLNDLEAVKAWVEPMDEIYSEVELPAQVYEDMCKMAKELDTTPEMYLNYIVYRIVVKRDLI